MISSIIGIASRVLSRRRLSSLLPFPSSRNTNTTEDREVLSEFKNLMGRKPSPSINEVNKFLSNTIKASKDHNVHALVNVMEPGGFKPNLVTYNILMNFYGKVNLLKFFTGKLGRIDLCYSVLGKILTLGFEPSVFTTNTLLRCLCFNNRQKEALMIFDKIKSLGYEVDNFTFGILIDGFCRTNDSDSAILFLDQVERHFISLDEMMFNTILNCLCKDGKATEALKLYDVMRSQNISPDIITFDTLICTFAHIDQFQALSLSCTKWRFIKWFLACTHTQHLYKHYAKRANFELPNLCSLG